MSASAQLHRIQTTCPAIHFWSISQKSRQAGTKTPFVDPSDPQEKLHPTENGTMLFSGKRLESYPAGGKPFYK
jgi:hypothetical protein